MMAILYYFKFVASSDFYYAFELRDTVLVSANGGKSFNSEDALIVWAYSQGFCKLARLSSLTVRTLSQSKTEPITNGPNSRSSSDSRSLSPNQRTDSRRSDQTDKDGTPKKRQVAQAPRRTAKNG